MFICKSLPFFFKETREKKMLCLLFTIFSLIVVGGKTLVYDTGLDYDQLYQEAHEYHRKVCGQGDCYSYVIAIDLTSLKIGYNTIEYRQKDINQTCTIIAINKIIEQEGDLIKEIESKLNYHILAEIDVSCINDSMSEDKPSLLMVLVLITTLALSYYYVLRHYHSAADLDYSHFGTSW